MQPIKLNHSRKIYLVLLLIVCSHNVAARSGYHVEVIVFDRPTADFNQEEWQHTAFNLENKLVKLTATAADNANLSTYRQLNKNRQKLGEVYRALALSNQYRPLLHVAWQQPAVAKPNASYVALDLQDEVAPTVTATSSAPSDAFVQSKFDGGIRISSGFYLYADIDLTYVKALPLQAATEPSTLLDNTDKVVAQIIESRRIELNQLHYFDHPLYGIILQVVRL